MDQKTTGSTISGYFFSQFDLSNQMTGYTLAGQAIFHAPVRGVIIDAAQIAVGFTRFERGMTYRTPAQLDEWINGTLQTIAYIRSLPLDRPWPMNLTACRNYGGCPFAAVCAADPSQRDRILRSDFTNEAAGWDPLERR